MEQYAIHNLSNAAIPGWNGLLVVFAAITVLICLSKKYFNMTWLLSIQAACLSVLTFTLGGYLHESPMIWAGWANLAIKGCLIPLLLWLSLKKSALEQRKEERFSNILAGVWMGAIVMIAVFVTPPLMEVSPVVSGRTLQFGIAGVFLGLWLMVYRNYLYSQVVGLLLMENSLYLTALALTRGMPLVVELGIMFDVFVCVVVMGILLTKVRRLFTTTEIEQLKQLRG